jgi:uncharacterized membrane protein
MYRDTLLVIHITAVAAWLGCNLTQLFLGPWFAGQPGAVAAAWYEATARLASRYYNIAGTALAVSGVLLVRESGYSWSAGFVAVGITVVVIGGLLGVLFFAPTGRTLAAAERDGSPAGALVRRYALVACVDTVFVLTAVLAMVKRWRA